jgi:ribosomal-protein-alanine N-acetyltransferase
MVLIESERLIIRDFIESDLHELFQLISDDTNMKYLPEIKVKTLSEAKINLNESIDESKKEERMKWFFAMIDKNSKSLIGSIGYTVEQSIETQKLVNLGYFTKKEYWGKGYTSEACTALIKYAFTQDTVIKIETGCLKENKASEKVMINAGLQKEGELLKHQIHENTWKDRLIYGLTREEWVKANTTIV